MANPRATASLLVALAVAAVIAGCGSSGSGSTSAQHNGPADASVDTVYMTSDNFTRRSITVQANQPVHFEDTVDGGGIHILCVGTGDGGGPTCASQRAAPHAPSELVGSGMTFNAGDKRDIVFTGPGTYHIICTIHPGMYLDMLVQ